MSIEQVIALVVTNAPSFAGLVALAWFMREQNNRLWKALDDCQDDKRGIGQEETD